MPPAYGHRTDASSRGPETSLFDVTFAIVDLETTGCSPATCAITEIGAVKSRRGECVGEFHTLVNPGVAIPPFITVLTGITQATVLPAPGIAEVLPQLLEFLGPATSGTVVGGHNVRFDLAFLDSALAEHGYTQLAHHTVDTLPLARRLVRDEVPDLRLETLARHFRTTTEPAHRALEDARATLELLHALIERSSGYGVVGLDDLLAVPAMRPHPSSAKLALTARLPRGPGVYLFRDRSQKVLFVGSAANIRAGARHHFAGDGRHVVPQLVREVTTIEHEECAHRHDAAARARVLVDRHDPRFNREARRRRRRTRVPAVPVPAAAG